MSPDSATAPPLGHRPNEPAPGKDSLEHPMGHEAPQGPACPDCGLPFGEHPDVHQHALAALPREVGTEQPRDPAEF